MQKIKKGDNVQIMVGKDAGKSGTVDKVLAKQDKVTIAGINVYKRHVKKQGEVKGGIIDLVKPVKVSNVELICPNCKKPTRVGFDTSTVEKQRICRKCQQTF